MYRKIQIEKEELLILRLHSESFVCRFHEILNQLQAHSLIKGAALNKMKRSTYPE